MGSPRVAAPQASKQAAETKEDSVGSDIKTEKVFPPEIEIEDTTSVTVLDTEYDDQDYHQPDFDYETSDDNHEAIAAREEAIKSHIYKDDLRKMFACDLSTLEPRADTRHSVILRLNTIKMIP